MLSARVVQRGVFRCSKYEARSSGPPTAFPFAAVVRKDQQRERLAPPPGDAGRRVPRRSVHSSYGIIGVSRANITPCGSCMTANVSIPGMSVGGTMVVAPSADALACEARVSATLQ
jgi:hypothetical protein